MATDPYAHLSTDELRSRLAAAKERKTRLQRTLSSVDRGLAPSWSPSDRTALSSHLLASLAAASSPTDAEDKANIYRVTGWTCFEVELEAGGRERREREEKGLGRKLGLGVRLETFWKGRFYEPFYLILSPASPFTTPNELTVVKHTIPHFIPLGQLVQRYLYGDGGVNGSSGSLELFLEQLQMRLQEYVARRQESLEAPHSPPGSQSTSMSMG